MRKFFKFIFKALLLIILLVVIVFGILYYKYDQPLPKATTGQAADDFACHMLDAINEPAYLEARYVEWKFRNASYKLDKRKQIATCEWSNYFVELHFIDSENSTAFKNGRTLNGNEKQDAIAKAKKRYNNDSFWVLAPFKLFDNGTTRGLVELEDDTKGLLITYTSGGSTPGDSYLWKVDENFRPTSFQMWVDIIPIGGLEATWSTWKATQSGAKISLYRSILGIELPVNPVEIFSNTEDKVVETKPEVVPIELEAQPTKRVQKAIKKKIVITNEMRLASLNKRFSQRRLEKDINFIRPVLTETEINRLAENIMLLMQTGDKIKKMTYREILDLKMRDSLY